MSSHSNPHPAEIVHAAPHFGLIVIGDEILSGKRADKHLPQFIQILGARGLQLAWAEYVGDDPDRITEVLRRAQQRGDVVFSCGGIGATPDDHTRQCAAQALGQPLLLHPEAEQLIRQRIQEMALEQGLPHEPDRPDNVQRLNMGVFPQGAQIIPNPYNKIPGFACGRMYFLPGFPVMAWPMAEWVLDTHYAWCFGAQAHHEQSVVVWDAMESALTPLMLRIEAEHPGVKVFSLPSVDHPQWGRHIELGVKGLPAAVPQAFEALLIGLSEHGARVGPKLVR